MKPALLQPSVIKMSGGMQIRTVMFYKNRPKSELGKTAVKLAKLKQVVTWKHTSSSVSELNELLHMVAMDQETQ